jgi:hypothetical protein
LSLTEQSAREDSRAIFAEHLQGSDVITRDHYYARRNRRGSGDASTARRSAGVATLRPRSLERGATETLSASPAIIDRLEPLLAEFLANAEPARENLETEVPKETIDAMRALGYIDD